MHGAGRHTSARRDNAGFTLVEILVALALSSVIMMALFGMFNSVVEVASSVKVQEEASYGQRTFEGILFDDLRSICTGKGSDFGFKGKNGSFLGSEGELMAFCSSASLNSSGSSPSLSMQKVEYVLGGSSDSRDIIRRERAYCGLTGEWEWVEAPIVKGVREIEVEYLDPMDNQLVTEWNGVGEDVPKAVYVRVTYPDNRESLFAVELSLIGRKKS